MDVKYNIIGKGNSIYVPVDGFPYFTEKALNMYENFNKEIFDEYPTFNFSFRNFVDLIYEKHNQEYKNPKCDLYLGNDGNEIKISLSNNKHDVVLGFSGGLDSVYQAICLKELGYRVHLFHLSGINSYENTQGTKASKVIADKLGVDYIESKIAKTNDKNNVYRQYWPENPMKNQLIISMMIDYCIDRGFSVISLGDDFDLSYNDAMVGVNLTDARELTDLYLNGLGDYIFGLRFIPIEKGTHKGIRLKKLKEYNFLDDYYSCVNPGRFNKFSHDKSELKYGIKLPKHNCGCCRKCAMHSLILHYTNEIIYPENYINHCWEIIWNNKYSADYKFFNKDIPLEERINNLFNY